MADFQLIEWKINKKTFSNRQNSGTYKDVMDKKLNAGVRILTGSSQINISLHMQWKYAKNHPKCCQIAKIRSL